MNGRHDLTLLPRVCVVPRTWKSARSNVEEYFRAGRLAVGGTPKIVIKNRTHRRTLLSAIQTEFRIAAVLGQPHNADSVT